MKQQCLGIVCHGVGGVVSHGMQGLKWLANGEDYFQDRMMESEVTGSCFLTIPCWY